MKIWTKIQSLNKKQKKLLSLLIIGFFVLIVLIGIVLSNLNNPSKSKSPYDFLKYASAITETIELKNETNRSYTIHENITNIGYSFKDWNIYGHGVELPVTDFSKFQIISNDFYRYDGNIYGYNESVWEKRNDMSEDEIIEDMKNKMNLIGYY